MGYMILLETFLISRTAIRGHSRRRTPEYHALPAVYAVSQLFNPGRECWQDQAWRQLCQRHQYKCSEMHPGVGNLEVRLLKSYRLFAVKQDVDIDQPGSEGVFLAAGQSAALCSGSVPITAPGLKSSLSPAHC